MLVVVRGGGRTVVAGVRAVGDDGEQQPACDGEEEAEEDTAEGEVLRDGCAPPPASASRSAR
ncbi:hypothetical protein [Blastococcus sp. SYSU D00813]